MAITRQPNGRYKVVVNISKARNNGDRRRLCKTVDSEAEAEALEARFEGQAPEPALMTVTGLIEHYIDMRAPDLAPQTENLYRGQLARYIAPTWFGALRFDAVDLETVRRFYSQLRAGTYLDDNPAVARARKRGVKALSEKTVRGVHAFLSGVYNDAVDLEWLARNPIARARKRQAGPSQARVMKRYDLGALRAILAAADQDLRDAIQTAIITGARIGELAALRWCDVDFATQTLTICGTVSRTRDSGDRPGELFRKDTTKNEEPRVLSVDAATVAMLAARYERHAQQASDAGIAPETLDGRAVFSRELEAGFTSPGAMRGWWRRACETAGVTLKFHDLRRVACSEMMAANVPVTNATDRSGHRSTQVFHDIYGAVRTEQTDPALDALARTWHTIAGGD